MQTFVVVTSVGCLVALTALAVRYRARRLHPVRVVSPIPLDPAMAPATPWPPREEAR